MRLAWSRQRGARFPRLKAGDPVYAFFTLREEGGYAEFVVAKEMKSARKPVVDHLRAGCRSASRWFDRMAGTGRWPQNSARDKPSLFTAGPAGRSHGDPDRQGARRARHRDGFHGESGFPEKVGADQAIDYTKTKFEDVVKDVDAVLDAVGGDTLTRSYGVVKKAASSSRSRTSLIRRLSMRTASVAFHFVRSRKARPLAS